jgi:hypothetical protein
VHDQTHAVGKDPYLGTSSFVLESWRLIRSQIGVFFAPIAVTS